MTKLFIEQPQLHRDGRVGQILITVWAFSKLDLSRKRQIKRLFFAVLHTYLTPGQIHEPDTVTSWIKLVSWSSNDIREIIFRYEIGQITKSIDNTNKRFDIYIKLSLKKKTYIYIYIV